MAPGAAVLFPGPQTGLPEAIPLEIDIEGVPIPQDEDGRVAADWEFFRLEERASQPPGYDPVKAAVPGVGEPVRLLELPDEGLDMGSCCGCCWRWRSPRRTWFTLSSGSTSSTTRIEENTGKGPGGRVPGPAPAGVGMGNSGD
jgi:hypothetical protein